MTTALVTMSPTELDRAAHMQRIAERRTTQAEVALELAVSLRQVERMYAAFKRGGPGALASKRRGRPSKRRLDVAYRQAANEIVRAKYADFGPTLAREKLIECHDLSPSVETLRKWMTEDGLWRTRTERRKRAQPPRARRDCLGELVQIDGSDHEWFEDRSPRCTLLVYIDDATSTLMELKFVRSESTFAYLAATQSYLKRHGKPVAFYSDKAGVFHVNAKDAQGGDGYTQFGRAMFDLNIEIICANSSAAKGRVERANQTLQDRLVKELRLRGISDRDAGNAYAEQFRADYNRRFANAPKSPRNAHRELRDRDELTRVFSWQKKRRLTINRTLHFRRVMYVVDESAAADAARGKRVSVREYEDGSVHIEYMGVPLQARAFPKNARVHQGAGQPGLPHRRGRSSTSSVRATARASTPATTDPLARVLGWADQAAKTPLSEHVDRIVDLVVRSFVPGTALVQFGGGDWNDSLQPVSEELAQRVISSWTVQMSYQALHEYREVNECSGRTVKAKELEDIADPGVRSRAQPVSPRRRGHTTAALHRHARHGQQPRGDRDLGRVPIFLRTRARARARTRSAGSQAQKGVSGRGTGTGTRTGMTTLIEYRDTP